MSKIFYLTRSIYPYDNGGGSLMRKYAVDYLIDLGWTVKVIRPNYLTSEIIKKDDVISIPFKRKYRQKKLSLLERIGYYEDYLDPWVLEAFQYLSKEVKADDIILSTSGGELGMIKLGSLLKSSIYCKFAINFRDPLNYGFMRGLRRDKKFHVGRVKAQKKYLKNSDAIITSNKLYAKILKEGFPEIKDKVVNNYFGFTKGQNADLNRNCNDKRITLAYAGYSSHTQRPEYILDVVRGKNFPNLEIQFIGNINNRKSYNLKNVNCKVKFLENLPHDKFQAYMLKNVDIGLVSLANKYYGACVPSKLYEYISLNLPILGFLPCGDARDIINQNDFGIATSWGHLSSSRMALDEILKKENIKKFKSNIHKEKNKWSMKTKIFELHKILSKLKNSI